MFKKYSIDTWAIFDSYLYLLFPLKNLKKFCLNLRELKNDNSYFVFFLTIMIYINY